MERSTGSVQRGMQHVQLSSSHVLCMRCCPQVRANVVGSRRKEWGEQHPINYNSAAWYLQGDWAGFKEDMSDAEERETVLLALQVGGWGVCPAGGLRRLLRCNCTAVQRSRPAQWLIPCVTFSMCAALGKQAGGR